MEVNHLVNYQISGNGLQVWPEGGGTQLTIFPKMVKLNKIRQELSKDIQKKRVLYRK